MNQRTVSWLFAVASVIALGMASAPRAASAQPTLAPGAMPGLVEVPLATPSTLVAGAAGAGYGYVGDVLGASDTHHRVSYDAAAAISPLPELIIAGRMGMRIDAHTGGAGAGNNGVLSHGSLTVRGRYGLRPDLHLGFEASALLPPADSAGLSLKALTPELNGMATYQTDQFLVSGAIGARINRSDVAFRGSTTLTAYESVALQRSDDAQLLLGVGGGMPAGPVWLLADLSYQPYVGGSAPKPVHAPLLLGLGARADVRWWLQLGMHAELSLLPYPPAAEVDFTPVPSRVAVHAFVAMRWDRGDHGSVEPESSSEAAPASVAEPVIQRSNLSGEVTGLHGHAIPDAAVRVALRQGDETQSVTLPGGKTEFGFEDLPIGDWELVIEAEGYETARRMVRLPSEAPLEIRLDRALPPGHLEVRVQDFRGRLVDAEVVLLPDRTPLQPTEETGLYTLDLSPGEYEIEIVSDGYAMETRKAVVAQNGVTIVVVDLRSSQEAR